MEPTIEPVKRSYKKMIIISIIAVVLIAGGVIGFLLLFKPAAPKTTPATAQPTDNQPASQPANIPDLSKDLGACTLVDKAFVKTTLGKAANSLQGPDNVGLIQDRGGSQLQDCVYSFVSGGTMDNNFNSDNGLKVEVYVHKDQASVDAFLADDTPNTVAVNGIGQKAYFIAIDGSTVVTVQYRLTIYSGLKHYVYKLSQPKKTATFTATSAQAALETIAKSATY